MMIVRINTLEAMTHNPEKAIPTGWAKVTVPIVYKEDGEIDMVPLTEEPYLRTKTERERAAEQAIPGSAEHRIKRNIEKTLRYENK